MKLLFPLLLLCFSQCLHAQQWTWVNGNIPHNGGPAYDNLNTPSGISFPGARAYAAGYTTNGNQLYVFGGSAGTTLYNNAFTYNPTTNEWTFVANPNVANGTGTLNTTPSAREKMAFASDGTGRIFMFGGRGRNNAGTAIAQLNSGWASAAANTYTTVGGDDTNGPGSGFDIFSGNPGAIQGGNIFPAANNGFYYFGGLSSDLSHRGAMVYRSPGGGWSQIGGSTAANWQGSVASPAAREGAASWVGSDGKFYIFGGYHNTLGVLNDLWRFDPVMNSWTQLKGTSPSNPANAGTLGIANITNMPRARSYARAAVNPGTGKAYIFGGSNHSTDYFNDVWEYDAVNNLFTWVSGSATTANVLAEFGTQGTASATVRPGGTTGSTVYVLNNNLYVFGGFGYTNSNSTGTRNTMWRLSLANVSNAIPVPTISAVSSSSPAAGGATINYSIHAYGSPTTTLIRYGTSATSLSSSVAGQSTGTNAVAALSTTLSGLAANTTYFYQIEATNATGAATPSAVGSFTTTGAVPVITNIIPSNVLSTTATISYTLNASNSATTSTVVYGLSSSNLNLTTTGGTATGSANTPLSVGLTGLTPATTYFYRVQASNSVGNATPSPILQFTTNVPGPTISATSATVLSSIGVTIGFTANANGVPTAATIKWGTSSGQYPRRIGAPTVLGTTSNSYTQSIFSLTAQTTYFYRVVLRNGNGDSVESAEQSFLTLPEPPSVSNASVANITGTSATISYTINASNALTTPVVRYGTSASNLNLSVTGATVSGNTNTNGSVNLTGLALNTIYHYRVEASNAGGNANPTTTASFSTLNLNVSAPVNGLVAYYGFNNNINSHNGQHNMTAQVAPVYTTGQVGNGISFSNTANRALFNNTITGVIGNSTPFTICFWHNTSVVPSTPAFATYFELGASAFARLQSSSLYNFLHWGYAYTAPPSIPNPTFEQASAGNVNAGATGWNHLAFVHRPGGTSDPNKMNFALYHNGVFITEMNAGTAYNIYQFANGFTIGGGTNSTNVLQANKRMDATIDEFYVYNRVLTPAEINLVRNETNGVILPAELSNFSGQMQNGTSQLFWTTEQETNTRHFALEYSASGQQYEQVATIAAAGRSSQPLQYKTSHRPQANGLHYYRLKTVDNDGRFLYSQVLKLKSEADAQKLQVYPNVATSTLNVQVQSITPARAELQVMAANGQTLLRQPIGLRAGSNASNLAIGHLPAGSYHLVLVQSSGERMSTAFQKK